MRRLSFLAVFLLAAAGADLASAQDAGPIGLVTGYPATIGILWRASERVAIRPEISFQGQWSDSTGLTSQGTLAGTTSTSGTSTSFGAAVLVYFGGREGLRPYFSPRFMFNATSSEASSSSAVGGSSGASHYYSISGSAGAEYALGRRFAVFGELGIGYTYLSSSNQFAGTVSGGTSTSTNDTLATRTAVGVIIWF
jgi:opacity protein-like surface antigen